MTHPLRQRLFVQFTLVAVVPFLVTVLVGLVWFYPYLERVVRQRQEHLARTITTELDSYLRKAGETVHAAAALPLGEHFPDESVRRRLDAQVQTSETLRSLYVVDRRGRVESIGLRIEDEAQRADLLGLDLSRTSLWRELRQLRQPVWSDIYLSVIGGGLAVAFAVPAADDHAVVGEVDLARLSGFLHTITLTSDQLVLVIDRNGQVIADEGGRFTAQQLNLNHIPLVRDGIDSGMSRSGEFEFNGEKLTGRLEHAPLIDWHVLVAQPSAIAFRLLRMTFGILGIALVAALLVGIAAALNMAHLLAKRFERLTAHARLVADGAATEGWPRANIREFEELADNLQRMATAIRERERQFATLTSNLPGMVHRCASDLGRLIYASHGSLELTGSAGLDLVTRGTSFKDLIHPDERDRVCAEVAERLRQGLPYEQVFRLVTRSGEVKWAWALGQGVESEGKLLVEGFVTDITQRVQVEEALREALQRAEAASRAKSDFLANMSHELRTPLNGILGMLQLLEHATRLEPEQSEYVQIAATSGWNLLTLLNDLLDLSRIEAGQMSLHVEPVDVAALAREVLQIFRPAAVEKGLALHCDCDPGLPATLLVDPTRLRQILLNLVGNAVKFTPSGEVRLQLGGALPDSEGRGQLRFQVADTGIGMDAELQQRIFEPFTQGEEFFRRTFQGAGLGLSIVKRLVDLMRGSIEVVSRLDAGTTMRVEIPVGWPQETGPSKEAA